MVIFTMEYPYPPTYRRYACNIECPQFKCRRLNITDKIYGTGICTTNIETNNIKLGNLNIVTGSLPNKSTTHYITSTEIPTLSESFWSGELTLFLTDDEAKVGVVKLLVSKLGTSVNPQLAVFGKVTNITTVTVTANSSTSIQITLDVACRIDWYFYGNK